MKILTALTYYRPHTSGLTIYAERLAKALVALGHEVTVLTMQYRPELPHEEMVDGVRVIRSPVSLRVSKGCLSPTLGYHASRLTLKHDVLHLHLPQFDAAGIALRGVLFRRPIVLTYHCDLSLPPGTFNAVVNRVVGTMNHIAGRCADRVVAYTDDYATHSPFISRYLDKTDVILPPVELPLVSDDEVAEFRQKYELNGPGPYIAMAARFAAEKGVGVLAQALPQIQSAFPSASVLFAGQYQNVLGESEYWQRVEPQIRSYQQSGHWKFLGVLNQHEMGAFFRSVNVLVVPSLNSTESFGLVQIEAMMNGVPCVASNLPGVRQPVALTGMGKIAQVGDSSSLASCISDVLRAGAATSLIDIGKSFSPKTIAERYAELFAKLLRERRHQCLSN